LTKWIATLEGAQAIMTETNYGGEHTLQSRLESDENAALAV
jgi:hypothetical protein